VDPLRSVVAFSDGGSGRLLDQFGECVDAVVVSSTNPHLEHMPSRASWPLVAGQPLYITDSPGKHVPVSIMDVDLNLGVLRSALFPIRFSTDWSGQPGQSGALIIEPIQEEPAGSYLGVLRPTITSPAGGTAIGFAQSCYQLETATGMEFYL
jgi:hypothetical protein